MSGTIQQKLTDMSQRAITAETEVERLRRVLYAIHKYADGCMEGAGEPEFSQFSTISTDALRHALIPRGRVIKET